MKNPDSFLINAMGRQVPREVNGQSVTPFMGVGRHIPTGTKHAPKIASCASYPDDGNKLAGSLKEALIGSGLRNGMTLSTHHHFRNGDLIANMVFDIAAELGVRDLVWFPSASFECHAYLIKYLEDGTIHHIEGSLNGSLGRFASGGRMRGMGVLRSHGGRHQAIQDGEVHVDIAIIAAPSADCFGNANGVHGPAACGSLGFALADSQYADKVIVATDNLVPFPCVPWQIQGNNVDFVVQVDRIGIPEKIVSGTTELTKSPDRLHIAALTSRFCEAAGIIHDGFSFQTGAGGISLAATAFFRDVMKRKGLRARFARGGSNTLLVSMLEEGLLDYIIDGQTFDLEGVRSMRDNPNHVWSSPFSSYNFHGKGNFASLVDVAILGATEIDVNFNANVVTHSDGYLLHGIGGWQNCLFSKTVILTAPLFRDRIPVIRDEVTTLCGPGELIDVVVTERGIAINPLRKDLIDLTKNSGLPIVSIQDLKEMAEKICDRPATTVHSDVPVAVVKWVDGTIMDTIWKVSAPVNG